MNAPKQGRHKIGSKKLEPIDWREFANDAVLNGNMSTLYHRPATEDPTAYASPEALVEIKKRVGRPTVGPEPTATPDLWPKESNLTVPTVGAIPSVGAEPRPPYSGPPYLKQEMGTSTVDTIPTAGLQPTGGFLPTVGLGFVAGLDSKRRVKPIGDVRDALTLAGQVLYKTMYGAPDDAWSKSCTKGYRQLAAEAHLDKDTVRDLICEFKEKGILHETGTYDPDTRSAKTYEVLSYKAILQIWREANLLFVTTGRQRPMFCTAQGELLTFRPTVGGEPGVTGRAGNPA
jgi:hypothetical protein